MCDVSCDRPVVIVEASTGVLITGGLLVGLENGIGAGCTIIHGICGVARLSRRSDRSHGYIHCSGHRYRFCCCAILWGGFDMSTDMTRAITAYLEWVCRLAVD